MSTYDNLWLSWKPEVHTMPDQIKRQQSACDSKLTPLSSTNGVAMFRGSKKDYSTTLTSCQCVDFGRRHLPCKHIYRLAYELGLFSLNDVKSLEISFLNTPRPTLQKKDVIPILKKLDEEQAHFFSRICYDCKNNNESCVRVDIDDTINLLYELKLIQDTTDRLKILSQYHISELREIINTHPETSSMKAASKIKLVQIIKDYLPNINITFPKNVAIIELHDNVKHLAFTMKRYLDTLYPYKTDFYF